MPRNSFTPVSVRRRSAAHGCTTVHPDARSAGGTIRGLTEDYRANYRVINNLSHTLSTPGNNPVRWGKVQHRGSQVQASTGPITGSICYDQGLHEHSSTTQKSRKIQGKRPYRPKFSSPAARLWGLRPVGQSPEPLDRDPPSNEHPRHLPEAVDLPDARQVLGY